MVSINNIEIDVPESCVECDIAKVGYYYDDTLVYCPLVKAFFEKILSMIKDIPFAH